MSTKIERKGNLLVVRLQVSVNYNRTWQQLITAAGPQTSRESLIWEAGVQYPAPKRGTMPTNITLCNYGRNWESEEVVAYAKSNKLDLAGPWELFAIGEAHPRLNRDLGKNYLAAVSLQQCKLGGSQRVPFLWFSEDYRKAYSDWFDGRWDGHYWFALLGEF